MIEIRRAIKDDIEGIIEFFDRYTNQLGAFIPNEKVYVTITGKNSSGVDVRNQFGSLKDLDKELIEARKSERKKILKIIDDMKLKKVKKKGDDIDNITYGWNSCLGELRKRIEEL
jgi:hypothetical protein